MKKIKNIILIFIIGMFTFVLNVNAESIVKIDETEYETFNDAYDAAEDGDTIELLGDTDIKRGISNTLSKDITINLGGHKLTNSQAQGKFYIDGNIKIIGDDEDSVVDVGININQEGKLTIENVKINYDSSISGAILNKGVLVINNVTFNLLNNSCGIVNEKNGVVTINSGNIEGYKIFDNEGKLTINNGNFKSTVDSENKGELIINSGTFDLQKGISNNGGKLTINGGTFTGKEVAYNYDAGASSIKKEYDVKSIINVNNGTFNVTGFLFNNASMSSNSEINIYGGTMKSSIKDDYALGCHNEKNNSINIYGGNIEAKTSKGIFLTSSCSIYIGNDDNDVKSDKPIINISSGKIDNLGKKATVNFYDGKFIISNKLDTDAELIVPKGYEVKYDKQDNGSYIAYLVKTGGNTAEGKENETEEKQEEIEEKQNENKKEEKPINPPTGIKDIILITIPLLLVGSIVSFKKKRLY